MNLKPSTLAMILAGGRVNELNVLTHYRPKSAVPFGGVYRVIDFALSNLMRSGLERIAILSQFRSFSLINHIGIGAAWDMLGKNRGVSILPPSGGYGNTSWYKGSADAIYQNIDFIEYHNPKEVLILSGDHVYNMDYREMIAYHREKDADLTIACVQVPMEKAHRFGLADIDNEDGEQGGRVQLYKEKPDRPQCNWASLTVYCFKPKILIDILKVNASENSSFEFGRDIIPRLMYEQKKVYGYKFRGYWGYTRTMEEYWQTNMDLLGPEPKIDLEKWGVRTNMEHRDVCECQPLKIGPSASIQDSLVYNGCIVEGRVERSILFPGVHVKKGAVVKDSVLFFNNKVGHGSRLEKVVSDVNVSIGKACMIGDPGPVEIKEVTVLGWNNFIPDNTQIGSDCTVYPALPPEKFSRKIKTGEMVR